MTEDNSTIELYYGSGGEIIYDVPGGYMTTPPHVRTPKDCLNWFGGQHFTFVRRGVDNISNKIQRDSFLRKKEEAKRLQEEREKAEKFQDDKKDTSWNKKSRRGLNAWRGRVAQYTLDGKLVKTYESTREAARCFNTSLTSISYACKAEGRSAHGYQWRWYLGDKPARKIGKFIDGRSQAAAARKTKKEVV